jgi:hypothetical protein
MVTSLVDARFKEVESSTKVMIASQEALLVTIAEITARNGADTITESIVKDCSIAERSQFENLLDNLNNNLSQTQLTELERLFGRCGSFFSERKSVMVSRLSREIDVYDGYVAQLGIILGDDLRDDYSVDDWQTLASLEQKRSDLFTRLVSLQDEIITELLAGSLIGSPEMTDILFNVNEVQGTLAVISSQSSDTRARLISL